MGLLLGSRTATPGSSLDVESQVALGFTHSWGGSTMLWDVGQLLLHTEAAATLFSDSGLAGFVMLCIDLVFVTTRTSNSCGSKDLFKLLICGCWPHKSCSSPAGCPGWHQFPGYGSQVHSGENICITLCDNLKL